MTQTFTTPRPSSSKKGDNTKVLIIALALGALAVVLNFAYIYMARAGAAQSAIKVFVLTRKVAAGQTFKQADYTALSVPEKFGDTLHRLRWITDDAEMTNYVGKRIEAPSPEGAPVTTDLFYAAPGATADTNIPEGMLAVSLPVNSRTVPGMLRKGMTVNISAPFNLTGSSTPTVLRVMEDVQVQALGTNTIYDNSDPDNSKQVRSFSTITILVDKKDWTDLALIERIASGEFELAIRNPKDTVLFTKTAGINPAVIEQIVKLRGEPASEGNPNKGTPPKR